MSEKDNLLITVLLTCTHIKPKKLQENTAVRNLPDSYMNCGRKKLCSMV